MNSLPGIPQFRIEIRQQEGRPPELIVYVSGIQDIGIRILNELGRSFENSTVQPLFVGERPSVASVEANPQVEGQSDRNESHSVETADVKGKPLEKLAKQFIPERLLNLIMPKFIFQRAKAKNENDGKTHVEKKLQNNQASKNESASKGEAKLVDSSTPIPEEVDPLAQIPKDLFDKAAKQIPEKNAGAIKETSVIIDKFVDKEIHQIKGEKLDQTSDKHTPNEITKFVKGMTSQLPSSSEIPVQKIAGLGVTVSQIILPQSADSGKNQSDLKGDSNKVQATVGVDNKNNETVRPKGNEGLPIAAFELDKEVHKPVSSRKDVNYNQDRNENNKAEPTPKHNDRVEFRFPALPEMRNGEGDSTEISKGNKGSKLLKSDGHYLGDLALMMLCAVLCGSRTPSEIFHYLQARKEFFTVWLGLKEGLPSLRVITFLLSKLNPSSINRLLDMTLFNNSLTTLRKLKVWENDRGLVLAELMADVSEDDPVPFAEALEVIFVEKAVISLSLPMADSRGAQLIRRQGGEYIFSVKGIHGDFYEQVRDYFEGSQDGEKNSHEKHQETAAFANYIELKTTEVTGDLSWLSGSGRWSGLKSAARIITEIQEGNRQTIDRRFYLTSLPPSAQDHAHGIRTLSAIENRADWYMDVDYTRGGADLASENFECLKLYSLNLLTKGSGQGVDIQSERRKAAKDNSHLRLILNR